MEGIRKLGCLAEREDYEFKIESGQLLYGPPRRILDDFPTRDTEIYVRLPKEIDCCKLVEMFSQVGRVYMVIIHALFLFYFSFYLVIYFWIFFYLCFPILLLFYFHLFKLFNFSILNVCYLQFY